MFDHFLAAQAPIYPTALAELDAGQKRTHWMWFIFPQLRGLGASERAIRYGLADLEDARTYLAHPILGPRLRECTAAVLRHPGRTAHEIFGSPDDLKFRSAMTLFAQATDNLSRGAGEGDRRQAVEGAATRTDENLFRTALARFFDGVEDEKTLALLGRLPLAPLGRGWREAPGEGQPGEPNRGTRSATR